MTYDTYETSTQGSEPIELYTFAYGDSVYTCTSSRESFTDTVPSPDVVYVSVAIDRAGIESSREDARNSLKLTVPRTFPVAELFRVSPPTTSIAVTVRRVQREVPTEFAVIWVGRVMSCRFSGAEAELNCEPITISAKRTGLRRVYQKGCPHVLYGSACGVDKSEFETVTTVASVSGLTLTVGTLPAYTYGGGFVERDAVYGVERRFIESHTGSALLLTQSFAGIAVSDEVRVYPGCNHTLSACDGQFDNALNYGGFVGIPSKNPFENSVF